MADENGNISVKEDIAAMFDTLGSGVTEPIVDPVEPVEPAPVEPAPVVEPVPPVNTDPVPPVTPVAAEPVAPAGGTGSPEPSTEPSIEETLRAEIARMAGLLAERGLTGDSPVAFPTPTPTPAPAAPVPTPTAPAPNPLEAVKALLTGDLLTAEEVDAVIDKPELLNAAYKRANEALVQNLFAALPTIINSAVTKEIQVNKLVTTFYELNKDLTPYADFVKLQMQEVERQNPQKTYREIFTETATQCRKRLGLKEPAGGTPDGQPTPTPVAPAAPLPPAFAGSRNNNGRPAGSPSTKEPFDPDLDAMFRLT